MGKNSLHTSAEPNTAKCVGAVAQMENQKHRARANYLNLRFDSKVRSNRYTLHELVVISMCLGKTLDACKATPRINGSVTDSNFAEKRILEVPGTHTKLVLAPVTLFTTGNSI